MMVLKHILVLLILSILFVFCLPYFHQAAEWLVYAHTWISDQLKQVFTVGQSGNIARQLIALLALPILCGLIPAILFWIVRRQWSPVFLSIIWIVWLLEIGVLAMTVTKAAT
jgi:hypothetical protein